MTVFVRVRSCANTLKGGQTPWDGASLHGRILLGSSSQIGSGREPTRCSTNGITSGWHLLESASTMLSLNAAANDQNSGLTCNTANTSQENVFTPLPSQTLHGVASTDMAVPTKPTPSGQDFMWSHRAWWHPRETSRGRVDPVNDPVVAQVRRHDVRCAAAETRRIRMENARTLRDSNLGGLLRHVEPPTYIIRLHVFPIFPFVRSMN